MDRILDLDAVAEMLEAQRQRLIAAAFSVAPLTWRDASESWPWTLKTDRATVADPDSVGLRLETTDQFAEVVIFRGGWADACWGPLPMVEDPTWHSPPDLADLDAVARLLARAFDAFGTQSPLST
jgi:hypothetical protein